MDLVFSTPPQPASSLRRAIRSHVRLDETTADAEILAAADIPPVARDRIAETARQLVTAVRRERHGKGGIDAFLHEYALSSQEGVALLCLAEALLRIPDAETVDQLIRDKLGEADWARHLGHSDSVFVNASTWALMLTGRLLRAAPAHDLRAALRRFVTRSGEPVVRQAVTAAMRILARQFVMGRTIEEALDRARPAEAAGYRHSYDMLGEAAHTAADAARYLAAYENAIAAIGQAAAGRAVEAAPGISVKLSALHPRYEMAQRERVLAEMTPPLLALAGHARQAGIGFTIDAEEADRLDLSLDLIEALALAPELAGWDGLGLAVQAYQKRALPLIDWLADLARRGRRRLMVRLVKGAYWDSEIKRSQERGLAGYPVYTRKVATDVSYLGGRPPAARWPAASSTRNSRPTTRTPLPRSSNSPAIAGIGNSSACTAWAKRSTTRSSGRRISTDRAGSMRRSAATRNCSPTSCAGCSKTAPTPRLSIALSMTKSRSTRSSPIRSRAWRGCRSSRIRASRCRAIFTCPAARIRAGIDLSDPPSLNRVARRPRRGDAPAVAYRAVIGGVEQPGEAKPVFDPSDHRGKSAPSSRPGRSSSTGRSTAPSTSLRPGTGARPVSARPSSNAPPISSKAMAPS